MRAAPVHSDGIVPDSHRIPIFSRVISERFKPFRSETGSHLQICHYSVFKSTDNPKL